MPTNGENKLNEKDGWDEYRIYILKALERYNEDLDDVRNLQTVIVKDLSDVKAQLAGLKVQSGIWGLIAGSLPVLVAMLLKWMFGV